MADLSWRPLAAGHNWNDSVWSLTDSGPAGTHAAPTSADNAHFSSNDNSSCNIAASANCANLTTTDGTGWTGSLTGSGATLTVYGSIAIGPLTNWTFSGGLDFSATTTGKTIAFNGVAISSTPVRFNGVGGDWTLQDAIAMTASATLSFVNGTLTITNKTVTVGNFFNGSAALRTLNMAGATVNVTATSGTPWNASGANLTLSAAGSTINYNGGITGTASFTGGGYSYGTLRFGNAGATGTLAITDSNTFEDLQNNSSTARTVQVAHGTTQTLAACSLSGSSGHILTLKSDSAGSAFTFSKASGVVNDNWMSVQDSTATGGATWYAGANSTSVSGNSGWLFQTYVQRDSGGVAEKIADAQRDSGAAGESTALVYVDGGGSIEALGGTASDADGGAESLFGAEADAAGATEFLFQTAVQSDAAGPIEALTAVGRSDSGPLEAMENEAAPPGENRNQLYSALSAGIDTLSGF